MTTVTEAGGGSSGTAALGLTSDEARRRLERDGPNVLPQPRPPHWWKQLAAQLTHFFALMLWVAGALAFAARLPQLGVAIYVVVVVNAGFAFAQEYRAERAAEKLRDLLPRTATVVRGGRHRSIDATELVLDDLVVLEAGDRISADIDLIEAHAVAIDVSTLTGESVPDHPDIGGRVFAGTYVVEGEGAGRVVAVGSHTRLASIALLARSKRRPPSPLARELHRVVVTVARVAVGAGLAFFGLAVVLGTPVSDGFLFAVGVTVALVPEGLLPTVTLSLARGAQRMAHRNALVRRLESVETLGSTTFVCTDKTGTLTVNQMEVLEVWTPVGSLQITSAGYDPEAQFSGCEAAQAAAVRVAEVGRACSRGRVAEREGRWRAEGDPMEAAIDALARRLGAPADGLAARPVSRRFPFDPLRRRMSVVIEGDLLAKGAPEAILPRCVDPPDLTAELSEFTSRGLRVLAVARRAAVPRRDLSSPDDAERALSLLGLLAFEDPPRPSAARSVARCRRAGIRIAMVTGDHPATALAVAEETGVSRPGEAIVLEGDALPDDDAALGELVDREGVVIARVTPDAKLRIARSLQKRGHVVAMTGDGVNDGPALQQADIGIAMGSSGTDVAREASDLVLLDDDFDTIVAAIEQGRATYANVRRFLTYHLTDNVAELTPFLVWALSASNIPLALGVLQILFLDIGTDLLPALALGGEPPSPHVLDRPPTRRHLIDRTVLIRVFAVLGPAEAVVEMLAFFTAFWLAGWRLGRPFPEGAALLGASGAAFAAVVVGQAANAFACRSTVRPAWRTALLSNRLLLAGVAAELVALGFFLAWDPIAHVLGQQPPPAATWLVIALVVPVLLGADGLHKWLIRRRIERGGLRLDARGVVEEPGR